jgi:TRAP-type C4-dicarboxylate transport system substrate-binding protein
MKAKKMRLVLMVGVVFFLSCSIVPMATRAYAAEPIKLKVLSSFTAEHPWVQLWLIPYVQKLNQGFGGRVQVSWVGPEAVPPFEQLRPVSSGLFDMLFTSAAYHTGELGVAYGMDVFEGTPKERRAFGFYDFLDEAYKKENLKYFAVACGGVGYNLLLKNDIKKADLSGLKIRSTPGYDAFIKALNGSPVRIAAPEIYTALEKGTVDGTAWPGIGALSYKWYEVVKFIVRPTFGEVVNPLYINLDTWNKLPKDVQGQLMKLTIEMEDEGYRNLNNGLKEEEQKLLSLGMKFSNLPPAEGEKLKKTFAEQSWKEVVFKYSPDLAAKLKSMADKFVQQKKYSF